MDTAREYEIPAAFDKFKDNYPELAIINEAPVIPDKPVAGPIPRPTFKIVYAKTKELVADLYPNGYSKCHVGDYKSLIEKIAGKVEGAAQNALEEYERYEENRKNY